MVETHRRRAQSTDNPPSPLMVELSASVGESTDNPPATHHARKPHDHRAKVYLMTIDGFYILSLRLVLRKGVENVSPYEKKGEAST
jgi:hypothetical protein